MNFSFLDSLITSLRVLISKTYIFFFHGRATAKKKKNHISRIKKKNSQWTYEGENIEEVARDYFQNLFATSHPTSLEEAFQGVEPKVMEEIYQLLILPYTSLEMKEALFQMAPTKAPSSDGILTFFYQKHWDLVGEDITKACLQFLNHERTLD